jgi:hypothetical protein
MACAFKISNSLFDSFPNCIMTFLTPRDFPLQAHINLLISQRLRISSHYALPHPFRCSRCQCNSISHGPGLASDRLSCWAEMFSLPGKIDHQFLLLPLLTRKSTDPVICFAVTLVLSIRTMTRRPFTAPEPA